MSSGYRYSGLRAATFVLGALPNAGYNEAAQRWRDWPMRDVGGATEIIRTMNCVDCGRHLSDWTVGGLAGYGHARPVNIGNIALGLSGLLLDRADP